MDLNAIRKRLGQLQTTNNRTSSLWKPQPGKTQIRVVPYEFNKDNPFIELFFHYNLNNRSYLSPISFGRPDPIEEFAQKLKGSGNKEDYQLSKKLEAKMRTLHQLSLEVKNHKVLDFGDLVKRFIKNFFQSSQTQITEILQTQSMVVM